MAAPNIVNVATITGKTAYATPANTSANILLANASGSGKVYKINMIMATNIDGASAVAATVALNTTAAGNGTSYSISSSVSVPANSTLIVCDKSTSLYLEEDKSVLVTSGTASKITYIVSYEEIS